MIDRKNSKDRRNHQRWLSSAQERPTSTIRRPMKVAAIAAGVMIAGSAVTTVAVAAVPGTDGMISGCRVLSSGVLRVIDAEAGEQCRTGEQPLDWNQQGVPGPTGETGAPGPSGVSRTHVGEQHHGDVVQIGPSGARKIITLTVPAGKYIVQGHGQVQGFRDEGSLTSFGLCRFEPIHNSSAASWAFNGQGLELDTITLLDYARFDRTTTIEMVCENNGLKADVRRARILATAVDEIVQ